MKRICLIISLLACSALNFAQTKTVPLNKVKNPSEGLIYSLPKTKIIVEVKTRRIQETPGIYYPYAERYLGLKDICQSETVHYEIEDINVRTKAIPDPENTYVIVAENKKQTPSIELTSEGFLRSINGNSEIKKQREYTFGKIDKTGRPCNTNYQTQESSIITQEMQQSNSTAKMAELAATQLFNIREARINALTLEAEHAPSDGKSYEIILSELNRMEKYYTELFTGKRVEKIETTMLEYEPQKSGEEILFRFSQLKGIVDKTNLGGYPISINLQKAVDSQAELVRYQNDGDKKDYSVFYRLPGKAQVKITDTKTTFYDQEIEIAQFGKVMTLPSNISSAEFCPETGAIVHYGK